MNPIDRYLRAVRFWLPRDQRDDIAAELAEELRSQVEEREASLGRPLDEAELKALVKAHGQPLTVAGRYMPQRYLIGPALFPIYRLVLTGVLLFYLVPAFLLGAVLLAFDVRIPHLSWESLLVWFFQVGAYASAIITLVFALIERSQDRAGGLEAGSSVKRDPNRASGLEAITEILAAGICLFFWLGLIPFGKLDDVAMSVGPAARGFYWPVVLWLVSGLVLGGIRLRSRLWTPHLATARLVQTSFALAVFGGMLLAWFNDGSLVAVTGPGLTAEQIAAAEKWTSVTWAGIIGGFVVGLGITLVQDLRRLRRVKLPAASGFSRSPI